ncbi:MAG TPA: hypothetical protein VEA44_16185 [Caulobacter sp.]|nr:hypothetical protein [Caulobacter sp.]
MTAYIGALYGAAHAAASWQGLNPAYRNGRVARLVKDYWTGDAAQNDTVSLGFFDWGTVFDEHSRINFSDFGTSVNLDVGDATNPDGLIDGQDISTAAGNVELLKSVAIGDRHKPLWQMLGHASIDAAKDIAPQCELLATFMDANPASGTLAWTIYGSPQ